MLQFHNEHQALATLAVQSRQSSRQLLFNDQLQLAGRRIGDKDFVISEKFVIPSETRNPLSPTPAAADTAKAKTCHSEQSEESAFSSHSPLATSHSALPQSQNLSPLLPLAFSGIHVISPHLLPLLTESTPVFSIIDSYLRLSSPSQKILAFRHDHSYWRDLGKPADLAQASLDLQQDLSLGSNYGNL